MSNEDIGTAETEPPPNVEQEPLADAPCDAPECTQAWKERVEWTTKGGLVVRYACRRHAYLYLMGDRGKLPH